MKTIFTYCDLMFAAKSNMVLCMFPAVWPYSSYSYGSRIHFSSLLMSPIFYELHYGLDHMIKASIHKMDHWTNLDGGR